MNIDLGIDLDELVQFSLSDFQAVDYAFDGDEIFDFVHYTTQGRNVTGANPFTDYAENGWKLGLDPHPLFDVSFYLGNNTDVRDDGAEPLKHYTAIGFAEPDLNFDRDPHPLFDTSYYNENNTDVVDFNKSPLSHFVENGFKEDFDARDPNPFFDSSYYNANNPDVVAEGVNPLTHYVQFGWRESLPDNEGGTNPNRDPNPLFDTEFYFETHDDVKFEVVELNNPNANPLQHYLEFGDEGKFAVENRITHPIYEGDSQIAFSSFIDGKFDINEQPEAFQFVENKFAGLNFDITPREEGGILVASPTLLFNPFVIEAIKYTVYVGGTYIIADQLDVPESAATLYELSTQTSLYESFSIDLGNLFTGTPPILEDAIESTPEVETFPRGNTLENLLDLDGRFFTPLEPINDLTNNTESFPQRDEFLDSILDEPLVFPDQQIPTGTYVYPSRISSNWSNDFRNGENSQISVGSVIQENLDRAAEIRQELINTNQVSRGRTRNIAYADYTLTDQFGNTRTSTIEAFSGQENFGEYAIFVPLIDRVLKVDDDELPDGVVRRIADSEPKILERLIEETTEFDEGIVTLYSSNFVCDDCGAAIEKFLRERPNIRIRILEGN